VIREQRIVGRWITDIFVSFFSRVGIGVCPLYVLDNSIHILALELISAFQYPPVPIIYRGRILLPLLISILLRGILRSRVLRGVKSVKKFRARMQCFSSDNSKLDLLAPFLSAAV
jgi:hypothetical protein